MSGELSHEEGRELLALDALDALSGEEQAALERHVTGCDACARERAALRDAAGALAYAAEPAPLDTDRRARTRRRLLARAAADRRTDAPGAGAATPVTPLRPRVASAPPRLSTVRTVAAAAIVLVTAGVAAWAMGEHQRAGRLREEVARLQETRHVSDSTIAALQATIASVLRPDVKVITASSTPQQPAGRMFWDQRTDRWTFVASHLPTPKPGRTYQLWLVTKDGRKLSAGTFAPEANGDALVQATYPLPHDQLALIAVTDEPQGGSPQPTTTPFLAGKAE